MRSEPIAIIIPTPPQATANAAKSGLIQAGKRLKLSRTRNAETTKLLAQK